MNIVIERFMYSSMGTFGVLYIDGKEQCYTVEKPWRKNEQNISCIPEGKYPLTPRMSGVVSRTTGGDYDWGFEVANVPNRTYIMIHPANTIADLEGCIGVGQSLGCVNNKWAVTKSRKAYAELINKIDRLEHSIEIRFNSAACDAYGG